MNQLLSARKRRGLHRRQLLLETLESRTLLSIDFEPITFGPVNHFGGPLSNPYHQVTGDFNGDGIPDLATAAHNENVVAFSFGRGDGSFTSPVRLSVPNGPAGMAKGFFDNDEILDLAIVSRYSNSVSIWHGSGDGTFRQLPGTLDIGSSVGGQTDRIHAADFNGDGKLDLAVDKFTHDQLWVFLGDAAGSFTQNGVISTEDQPWEMASADFNGDGKRDLATINQGSDSLTVYLGDGTGQFAFRDRYAVGVIPHAIVTSDFDRDGISDLAVGSSENSSLYVLRGDGDGTFTQTGVYPLGTLPSQVYGLYVIEGDFNRDGIADLAVSLTSENQVQVWAGRGDGTFSEGGRFATGAMPYAIAVADFNGDGGDDIAVDQVAAGNIGILLNQGVSVTPHFTLSAPASATVGAPFEVTVMAMDAQGNVLTDFEGTLHFASSDRFAGLPDDYTFVLNDQGVKTFAVTLGTGGEQTISAARTDNRTVFGADSIAGTPRPVLFETPPATYSVGRFPTYGVIVDLNGDLVLDLVIPNHHTSDVSVLLGTPGGSFQPQVRYPVSGGAHGLAVSDIDGDSSVDLAVANVNVQGASVLFGNGDGTFGAAIGVGFVGGSPHRIIAADFNHDGAVDLATANYDGADVGVLIQDPAARTFAPVVTYETGTWAHDLVAADLDLDGHVDFVVANYTTQNYTVLAGLSTGAFGAARNVSLDDFVNTVRLADFNRDGLLDLAIATNTGNSVKILMGNGDLTFQSPATYPVGLVADDIQVGDFNSDGLHDLIVGNVGEGSVSILLGNGNGTFQNDVKFGPVPTATGIMIGDIDGNGTLDAAVTNRDSESVSILFNRGEPGNDAPILAPIGDRSVNEEQLISFTVTVTDPDQPALTLTYSLDAASLAAGMTITAEGTFAWTPTEAQGGATYTVTITVTDDGVNPNNLTDSETFTITVNEVNVAPVLDPIGNQTVEELVELTFTASATDADAGTGAANTLTYSLVGAPEGTAVDPATGVFRWTPSESQGAGSYTFTVKVADNGTPALSDEQQVTVTVNEVNVAPVLAAIGNKTVDELVQLTFTVTASDPDLPVNGLLLSASGLPEGATFDPATGVFAWTPTEAQGPSSYNVTFTLSDGSLTDDETIAITVGEVNQAPVLGSIEDQEINEGSLLTFTVTASDPDLPANTLVLSASGLPTGATFEPATGVFAWTPTEAQGPGSYAVRFMVSDGSLTDEETATITVGEVNQPPVLGEIGSQSVSEGSLLTFTVTASDADLPANTLVLSAAGLPSGATFDPATGVFAWTPSEAQGPDDYQVTFTVGDGSLTDHETITITVNEVNQSPVALNQTVSTLEDVTTSITLLATDSDADPLTYTIVNWPVHGTLTRTAEGVYDYVPADNFFGIDSFDFQAADGDEDSNVATVTITVQAVNDAPIAQPAIIETAEDVPIQIDLWTLVTDIDTPLEVLRFTVTDAVEGTVTLLPDGHTAQFVPAENFHGTGSFDYFVTDPGLLPLASSVADYSGVQGQNNWYYGYAYGQVGSYNPAGFSQLPVFNGNWEWYTYNPPWLTIGADFQHPASLSPGGLPETMVIRRWMAEQSGDLQVDFHIAKRGWDGSGGNGVVGYILQNGAVVWSQYLSGTDSTGVTAALQLPNVAAGDFIEFAVGPNGGSDEFDTTVFTAQIALVGEPFTVGPETVDVLVHPVNDAPVLDGVPANAAISEMVEYTFDADATDVDLPPQALTFSILDAPLGAVIDPVTGVFTWTPSEAQGPQTYSFTVVASDGADATEAPITITVSEVNLPPVLSGVPSSETIAEMVEYTFDADATDVDVPAQTLTFSLVDGPAGAAVDPVTGVFTWTPSEAQGPGSYAFKVAVSDGLATTEAPITITVNEVNAAPLLAAIGAKTVDELVELTVTATATDADLPANTLMLSASGLPEGATFDLATGVFAWTPTEAQGPGNYDVTFVVSDGSLTDEETVTITVGEVNQAPVLGEIGSRSVSQGSLLTFTVTASDTDLSANTLTFNLVDAPAGAVIDPATGVFRWTPSEAQGAGSYTFTVNVADNGTPALSDEEAITVTVNEVNVAPVLDPIGNKTVEELVELTFTASATDADIPANTVTFSLVGAPVGASINATTGAFTWTPTEVQGPGGYTFTVKVADNGTPALSDEEEITVTVNEVNVAPVLTAIGNQTVEELGELTFTASATDADTGTGAANTVTYSLVGAPAGAVIDPATGVFRWTPSEAQGAGSYTFTVKVADNGTAALSDDEEITVTVNEVNVAPVLDPIGNKTVEELVELTFTASATDADLPANGLTFSLVGAPAGANINPTTGVFTWTPSEGQGPASYTFTVKVTDDGTPNLSDEEQITVTVTDANLAPTAVPDAYVTCEDNGLTIAAPGVLGNDADPNGDALTAVLVQNVSNGTLQLNPDGGFVYVPNADWSGVDSFTYQANDGALNSNTATVTITVLSAEEQVETVIDQVQHLIDQGVLNQGNGNSLIVKAQGAIEMLDKGKLIPAINKLNAFIHQVRAFVPTKLTDEQGQALIDAAEAAIVAIGPGGSPLIAASASGTADADNAEPVSVVEELVTGTIWIGFEDNVSVTSDVHRLRLLDAVTELNATFSAYGVTLGVLEPGSETEAHVRVVVDVDSPCGGVADGVLGCAAAGEITLVAGWAWYSEADAALIEFGEYDFQTIVTHELGHAVGLDHSGDEDSVMYEALADGEFRRNITEWDLTLLREGGDGDPSPLLARPRHRPTAESVTPELPPRAAAALVDAVWSRHAPLTPGLVAPILRGTAAIGSQRVREDPASQARVAWQSHVVARGDGQVPNADVDLTQPTVLHDPIEKIAVDELFSREDGAAECKTPDDDDLMLNISANLRIDAATGRIRGSLD